MVRNIESVESIYNLIPKERRLIKKWWKESAKKFETKMIIKKNHD
jgi:hypothetical protein